MLGYPFTFVCKYTFFESLENRRQPAVNTSSFNA